MVHRIALSSQDSVGLRHVRRNLAHALTRTVPAIVGQDATGVLITGQVSAAAFPAPPGWNWVVLPSVSVDDTGYRSRHLAADVQRVTAMRAGIIAGVLRAFAPDLFVADRHPSGVHGDLRNALPDLRATLPSCTTVLDLRDVLDRPAVARAEFCTPGWPAPCGSGGRQLLHVVPRKKLAGRIAFWWVVAVGKIHLEAPLSRRIIHDYRRKCAATYNASDQHGRLLAHGSGIIERADGLLRVDKQTGDRLL